MQTASRVSAPLGSVRGVADVSDNCGERKRGDAQDVVYMYIRVAYVQYVVVGLPTLAPVHCDSFAITEYQQLWASEGGAAS